MIHKETLDFEEILVPNGRRCGLFLRRRRIAAHLRVERYWRLETVFGPEGNRAPTHPRRAGGLHLTVHVSTSGSQERRPSHTQPEGYPHSQPARVGGTNRLSGNLSEIIPGTLRRIAIDPWGKHRSKRLTYCPLYFERPILTPSSSSVPSMSRTALILAPRRHRRPGEVRRAGVQPAAVCDAERALEHDADYARWRTD